MSDFLNSQAAEDLWNAGYVITPPSTKVINPSSVYKAIHAYKNKKQEHFLLLSLDIKGNLKKLDLIFKGSVGGVAVSPREVFITALKREAVSVIVAHNHPSGDLSPSPEDIDATKELIKAGKLLHIGVQDHVIFSKTGWASLRETRPWLWE
jgi:DNA repair protein RadC